MRRDISRRFLSLRESLGELSRPECSDGDRLLTDRTLRAAVERWMQVAIEACIALATHEYSRDAFLMLGGHGLIPLPLAKRLALAAGLRNLLVHEYIAVNVAQLAETVAMDLEDLRAFADLAQAWPRTP